MPFRIFFGNEFRITFFCEMFQHWTSRDVVKFWTVLISGLGLLNYFCVVDKENRENVINYLLFAPSQSPTCNFTWTSFIVPYRNRSEHLKSLVEAIKNNQLINRKTRVKSAKTSSNKKPRSDCILFRESSTKSL